MTRRAGRGKPPGNPSRRVALVPWGTPIEVFLDPLGRTLSDFCERMAGGWLFGYAEALQRAGYLPSIVVSSRTVEARQERRHAATGTPVVVLAPPQPERPRPPGLRRDLQHYRRALPPGLLRELRRHEAVLLQEYEQPLADLLATWGRLRGVPVLASFQGGVPPWEAAPLQRIARGPAVRQLAGLLVGADEEAARVLARRRVRPSRVHRVPNPVDTTVWRQQDRASARRRLAVPDDALVVAWHGRVAMRNKGLDVLVEAWRQVCAGLPGADLRLLLVGAGPDAGVLRVALEQPGLRGVSWLSDYAPAPQVQLRLAACDLWVSPSRHEGFAVAPLEAMASGRPVVLSDAPGARELAGDGDLTGGLLVPRGDPTALADALLARLSAPERLAGLGHAARRCAEQSFSLAAVSRQLASALTAAGCPAS